MNTLIMHMYTVAMVANEVHVSEIYLYKNYSQEILSPCIRRINLSVLDFSVNYTFLFSVAPVDENVLCLTTLLGKKLNC